MTSSAPILYVLGIEGQIYMAEALGKELNRPVIGIATCQRIVEILDSGKSDIFHKVYSLPDFYLDNLEELKKLSLEQLNKEQQNLEEKLNVGSSALYTNYDRTLRYDGDHNKVRYWQLSSLRLAEKLFEENDPAFMISGVATYIQHVFYDICKTRNIPYLRASGNRTGGMVMYHADGRFVGMEKYFNALQEEGKKAIPPQTCAESDAEFKAFVDAPRVPEYTVLGNTLGLNVKLLYKKISWAVRPEHLFPSGRVIAVDRKMNIENSPLRIALNAMRTGRRRLHLKILDLFDKTPNMSESYFYVPLHYAPEISDMYFGTDYDHHEAFIAHLSKHIPSGSKLYVKDHVCMWGRRPASFYQNLSQLYNVKLVDPSISTFELIKYAQATITVTGTAGWEAYLLGKPVVVLGDVFYNFLPNVLFCQINKEFFAKLSNYIKTFKTNKKECQNAYRAYYACSFKSPFVDIGETLDRGAATEASEKYAKNLHQLIIELSDEIEGKFPKGMIPAQPKKRKAS